MAGFFTGGSGGSSPGAGLDPADIELLTEARDQSVAARDVAQAAQLAAAAARSGAQAAAVEANTHRTAAEAAVSSAAAHVAAAAGHADDAEATAQAVGSMAAAVEEHAQSAEEAEVRARGWAEAPPGVEVEPGKYGVQHYVDLAARIATQASALPIRTLTDDDGPTYDVAQTDLFHGLKLLNTSELTLRLNPGLFTLPGPDGGRTAAWVKIIRAAAGDVSVAVSGSAATLRPQLLADELYRFSAVNNGEPELLDKTLSAPAGVKRRVTVVMVAQNAAANPERNTPITLTGTSGETNKLIGDTGVLQWNDELNWAAWEAPLADSASPTDVRVQLTIEDCFCYAVWVAVWSAASAVSGAQADTGDTVGDTDTDVSVTITAPQAQCVNIGCLVKVGADAAPVLIDHGTPQRATTTGGSRPLKDLSFVFFVDFDAPDGVARTYTGTSAKPTGVAYFGATIEPDSDAQAEASLIHNGTTTLTGSTRFADIYAENDGETFYLET